MKNPKSLQIIKRFFETLDYLNQLKITNPTRFCNENGIDRRNFRKVQKGERTAIELQWLNALVIDYHVSAKYLLTGLGNIFEVPIYVDSIKSVQK